MLHLHRSERADALVEPLAQVLAVPPADPFALDVVAVPTRGVERWLAQRLSHHLGTGPEGEGGVCANISFDSPARLVARALATVVDVDPDTDPWQVERLTWHLLEVVDSCAGEAWCSALGRHLGIDTQDSVRRGRRLQAARHLARLFTSYAGQRPQMVQAWAEGRDEDGTGAPVPSDLRWQPQLWRRLRDRVGTPSSAEALEDAIDRLTDQPEVLDLPGRLSVFGPTRLPEDQLRVLGALARHRDVHLWLPHPSPVLWQRVAEAGATNRRRRDRTPAAHHPLLASMARDATELQIRLTGVDDAASTHHRAPAPPATLLGALQRRLRDDDPDAATEVPAADDRSVQVHACHGRARQVEVLRETLIGLFADDRTLEPRDVIVMCPDIEAFAPLVAATFGLAPDDDTDAHPGRSLRVRLADRSLRQTNPLLSLVSTLLELADGRVTASQVVDLAGAEPVRRRFRLDDDDLDRIREWAATSGARWGEDRARRARFGLEDVAQGTWRTSLDRILLGAAMAEEDYRYVASALPLDDVDSTDIDLAGRLAELVERLGAVLAELDGTRPPSAWFDSLDRALHLLADVRPAESWQEVEARTVLDDARQSAAEHAATDLRLADVRALLAGRLRGRPTRAGFRTGALTVCSLEPMRAVPHRVVALLGMDDGAFPRGTGSDGDDVLLREPLVGERDRRGEDRQLFLDAVTAAGEHLVVLYSGADERTGAARPPAVPVGELLDALDRTATAPDGSRVRSRILVRHPLQTVDERNFTPGALGRTGPFSFDAVNHRAAVAGRKGRETPVFLSSPLSTSEERDPGLPARAVELADLIRTLEHPVRAFFQRRLGVQIPREVQDLEDRLPLSVEPLQEWMVGDALLTAALGGRDVGRAATAEWLRGTVPPRQVGATFLRKMREKVVPIANATTSRRPEAPAETIDVRLLLTGGRELTGTIPDVHDSVLMRPAYSKLSAKYRLRTWIELLALAAASDTDTPPRAFAIGRSPKPWAAVATSQMKAPSSEVALAVLADLVDLRDRAMREPLPMAVATACAYAHTRHAGKTESQALAVAAKEWESAYEQRDDWHSMVWGPVPDVSHLLVPPAPDEQAWWPEDTTRLGVLSRRLWHPVMAHEAVTHE